MEDMKNMNDKDFYDIIYIILILLSICQQLFKKFFRVFPFDRKIRKFTTVCIVLSGHL